MNGVNLKIQIVVDGREWTVGVFVDGDTSRDSRENITRIMASKVEQCLADSGMFGRTMEQRHEDAVKELAGG